MQPESILARLATAALLAVAACVSLPSYGQTVTYAQPHWPVAAPPPWALGAASGAQFGAQVSAMNPTMRCFGGRSFRCGAHFDPRPVFAGALIGGIIGALSTPMYYQAPHVALYDAPPPQRDSYGSSAIPATQAGSIADGWQRFGGSHRDERAQNTNTGPQFIEGWQRFFEPSQ